MERLPRELQLHIISYIPSQKDLKSISEVSKALNALATPILYANMIIQIDEPEVGPLELTESLRTYTPFGSRLKLVRNLHVVTCLRSITNFRCPYVADREDVAAAVEEADNRAECGIDRLNVYLMRLFQHLVANSLRSFSWELDFCVPSEILGRDSYIVKHQSQIEALSLITDATCKHNLSSRFVPELSRFHGLRSISWKAISTTNEFNMLKSALMANFDKLESFELYFLDPQDAPLYPRTDPFFVPCIYKIVKGSPKTSFPALKVLSLACVSLDATAETMTDSEPHTYHDLAHTLNFSNLSSLKLDRCTRSAELLEAITVSGQPIKLRFLELVMSTDSYSSISDFLRAFIGLEELYILYLREKVVPQIDNEFWEAFLAHKSTLKRLVYHRRGANLDEDSLSYICRIDHGCSSPRSMNNMLENSNLECVGLTKKDIISLASHLVAFLTATAPMQAFKLLHIRSSGSDLYHTSDDAIFETMVQFQPRDAYCCYVNGYTAKYTAPQDLYDFAEWAFGPEGFPKLQILAFGDFCYKGRFDAFNVLLRRNETLLRNGSDSHLVRPYRQMEKRDWVLWDGIPGGLDMLGCCPAEILTRRDSW
ncbi:hypothetical protein MMC18_007987 [Xylographa bjoerkii]|nr:hypothetical protein [Xylographa bjoerkii]